jgi:glycosyltransferase involved in cell wall biosynthesis
MKVGIYHELGEGDEPGGAECCVAILAEALQHSHDVEIVNHCPALGVGALARFAGLNLERVRLRHVPLSRDTERVPLTPWRRYRSARQWHASLSEGYDLFINLAHGLPPFCHAKQGILFVLFPFFRPLHIGPDLRNFLRAYDRWEWRRRIESYDLTLASSRFTQTWTRRWWNLDSRVLYPPADSARRRETKADIIVSVGRFSTRWHQKKQKEMVTAFRDIQHELPTWEYRCVGALSERPPDHTFLAAVQTLAAGYRVRVVANLPRADLETTYARAKIFWHATGYGEDDEVYPDRLEHFGIATVEAMAAGCVPVVIDKGGQREIVEHGISGFCWKTLDEMKEYTRLLAREDRVQVQMSEAARDRAGHFSRARFLSQFHSLIEPLMANYRPPSQDVRPGRDS